MVRSDLAGAGVMFTLDPDSGFPRVAVINAAWGLGENVVKGTVNPDQYVVFKPLLEAAGARPILERTVGSKEEKMIYRSGGGSESVVTDQGGRTSHAAIVSRELGIPAVVGTGTGTELVPHGHTVTLSCAEGDRGHVYAGALEFDRVEVDLENMPEPRTRIMLNVGNPDAAFRW